MSGFNRVKGKLYKLINGGYCYRFFKRSEEVIQPLAEMIRTRSVYSNMNLEIGYSYIGLIYLIPRLLTLIGFTIIVSIMTTEMPKTNNLLGHYIIPIIAHLKKDGSIVDIFLMACLNSIFVVIGSQLFLKSLLDNFDLKNFTIKTYFGLGFKLDLISEICFLLSYLALRNIYIF